MWVAVRRHATARRVIDGMLFSNRDERSRYGILESVPVRTILVVDDDADIRRMAALSLERIGGFRVSLADSAEMALEQAKRDPPDLLLLDVSMPGTDGPAILAALRAHSATERVPVVFLTAISSEDDIARLHALGVVDVISKPFDVVGLSARVRDIFSSVGLH
jgi:DNA-binding response OmpR family regulator